MLFLRHGNTPSGRENLPYSIFIFLVVGATFLRTVEGRIYVNSDCTMKCITYNGETSCNYNYRCSPNAQCFYTYGREGCFCNEGYKGDGETCELLPFTDCHDAYRAGNREDGVYTISPRDWPGSPFQVLCNMTSDGGGWTVFQRRVDGRTDFYRNWQEYKNGFGSPSLDRDFWLGNDKLHYLTSQKTYELRIDMVTSENSPVSQKYRSFSVGSESSKYYLTLDRGYGRTGMTFNAGRYFSTYDRDTDRCSAHNCAREHHGGWWYGGARDWCHSCYSSQCSNFIKSNWCSTACTDSNLNGDYNGGSGRSIIWYRDAYGRYCYMKYADMKMRPRS